MVLGQSSSLDFGSGTFGVDMAFGAKSRSSAGFLGARAGPFMRVGGLSPRLEGVGFFGGDGSTGLLESYVQSDWRFSQA